MKCDLRRAWELPKRVLVYLPVPTSSPNSEITLIMRDLDAKRCTSEKNVAKTVEKNVRNSKDESLGKIN